MPRCKRLPWKKLRYFPLTQSLQRMYSVPWIAENMTWHANASLVQNQAIMRHPMDSSCCSQVNHKWADFTAQPRNVRFDIQRHIQRNTRTREKDFCENTPIRLAAFLAFSSLYRLYTA